LEHTGQSDYRSLMAPYTGGSNMSAKHRLRTGFRIVSGVAIAAAAVMNLVSTYLPAGAT